MLDSEQQPQWRQKTTTTATPAAATFITAATTTKITVGRGIWNQGEARDADGDDENRPKRRVWRRLGHR